MALEKNLDGCILNLTNISKFFPGVRALDKVNFSLYSGEVHALVGENGAGKSTMIKIIAGIYPQDEGLIFFKGNEVNFSSPMDSNAQGIKVVYQELSLVQELSIMENVFLGEFPSNRLGYINWNEMRIRTEEILNRLGLILDPSAKVSSLRVAEQQIVEIARAISQKAEILIMDEPTSALSPSERDKLFELIERLKNTGVSVIYISHKIEEIFEIADTVTVLRDGKVITTKNINDTNISELVRNMVGHKLSDLFPKTERVAKNVLLKVVKVDGIGIRNISFDLNSGEVLGVFGLLGSGKEILARSLYGITPFESGEIYIDGKLFKNITPDRAIDMGIGLITENRREEGLVPRLSVKRNMTLPSLSDLSKAGWISAKKETAIANTYVKRLNIKTPSLLREIMYLSGGNQQKAILAKWLMHKQKVLIVSEPTRGIDVGSKLEIHKIIDEMANQGLAIIMISSEIEEILGLSDRIIVMHEGTITGEFSREEATKENLMGSAVGSVMSISNKKKEK